jgi:hypothetical protein
VSDRKFAIEIIRRDAGLPFNGEYTNREALIAVRDFVYRSMDPAKNLLPYVSSSTRYAALGSDLNYMFCGAASASYAWALNALGIRARTAQIVGQKFLAGDDFFQTHVTVEAWVDGRWEISDPTFNVSIACSTDPRKHLSVPEAVTCLEHGNAFVFLRGKSQGLRDRPDATALSGYFAAYSLPASDDEKAQSYPTANWLAKALALYH